MNFKTENEVAITPENVILSDFDEVLLNCGTIEIGTNQIEKVKRSYAFLKDFARKKIIYGINTGLGPMAQYKISEQEQSFLQYNLIRSHCSGTGNLMSPLFVKSAMICRLITLLKGYSGVHPEVVVLLKEFINRNIIPVVFEHGSVGASGDLVQLSHIALALIGEGEVHYKGKIVPTMEVLKQEGLTPVSVHVREGLALINGTSVMTGIGIINIINAKNLLDWAIVASAMINEVVDSYDDSFSDELNSKKLHEGQNEVARLMRKVLEGSKLIKNREEYLYQREITEKILTVKVQEYYSIRCVPQVLGPVFDTIKSVESILLDEANSVSDNPVIDSENKCVYHGGNFHGDYISLEMDKLKIVVTKLTMLMERQLNYILNPHLNEKFPPFVNMGKLGLNLGMQGVQFTATSTTAECQTLSFPNYVHSIPNNNDNQDIVSMGTNSALIAAKIITNAYEVLGIYFMALIQAVDCAGLQDKLSPFTYKIYNDLRAVVPPFVEDSTKYNQVRDMKNYLHNTKADLSKI
ncbi:MAG: aromatic amino acid ammonia-lyase [Bacteroidales bacterium]|nr:aromatic amino acid ammonia-lyase [Bacteroidales bacterium]